MLCVTGEFRLEADLDVDFGGFPLSPDGFSQPREASPFLICDRSTDTRW